jgi:hypothetical protein
VFKKLGMATLALMLLLAACGGDDAAKLSGEEQALADAMATNFAADPSLGITPEQGTCVGNGAVTAIGMDRLTELGITADNVGDSMDTALSQLTEAEKGQIVDVLTGCIDFGATLVAQMKAGGLSDTQATCIGNGLSDDMIRAMALGGMSGAANYNPMTDPAISEAFVALLTQCMGG